MTILGEYTKQPVEVEIFSIQFATDMANTDQIESAWQLITREFDDPWDQVLITAPYQLLLSDDKKSLVSAANISLPSGASDGYRISIANYNQSGNLMVGGTIVIPARGSSMITLVNGVWKEETKTHAVLVDGLNDQRVRTQVYGGLPYETYKIQVTVSTSEGRTLQDEFIVTIEET